MANKEQLLKYLETNYFKEGHSLYHAGINKINYIFEGNLKIEDIYNFLERQRSHTIYKETKKGALNPIYKRFKRHTFQIDLLELKNIAKENELLGLLLTVIDCYTKFAWAVPITNKESHTVLNAFKSIIDKLDVKPLNVVSDMGSEFKNKFFKKYLEDNYINHNFPYTSTHAGIIERFHRSLHRLIWPPMLHLGSRHYVKSLNKILKTYNSRPHRMLGNLSPEFAEQNPTNAYIATKNQEYLDSKKTKNPRIPRYKIGMQVRVKRFGDAFWRGYDGSFNDEVYVIDGVKTKLDVPMFKLKTLENEELLGFYYSHELSRVRGNPWYAIEKIVRRRGNQSLVKFQGIKKPEWIPTANIENLNDNGR